MSLEGVVGILEGARRRSVGEALTLGPIRSAGGT